MLQEHLASCESCSRELDSLRFTVRLAQNLPQLDVPRSFILQPSVRREATLFYFLRNTTAALAAVLLVLFAGSFYLQSAVPQTMTPSVSGRAAPVPATHFAQGGADVLGNESEPSKQPGARSLQKLQAEAAPAPEVTAKAGGTAPAEAPAAVAAAPKAVAPTASPQPMSGSSAGGQALAGPPLTSTPPAVSADKSATTAKKGETLATDQGTEEASKRMAQPETGPEETVPKDQPGPFVAVQATPPVETYGVQPESKWPLMEVQIGVSVLLALSGGATLVVWVKRSRP